LEQWFSGVAGVTALDGMGYAGGVRASRFVGGWEEAFYVHPSAGYGTTGGDAEQESFEEEAEDDGRWVVGLLRWFPFVFLFGTIFYPYYSFLAVLIRTILQKGSARGPGLGRRNRSQRLQEYASHHAALALSPARHHEGWVYIKDPYLYVTNFIAPS
jgi:hypothetical protein